jgi:hypothetical protein
MRQQRKNTAHFLLEKATLSLLFKFSIRHVIAYTWKRISYKNRDIATQESARRYYAVKEFLFRGVRNVFTGPEIIPDKRFLDPTNTR